ncbi:helix-turn-helix domain-containing protein [Pantanalinema rosaneae CENA516]|uniref:helix-turn-helix domain-containing protein n=1 Tax=Pantanalinema rosaneae TaxID=1620701 RepID=UPI003D6DF5F0
MTIILSAQDCDDLWEESKQTGTVLQSFDGLITTWQGTVPLMGAVQDWSICLNDGLMMRMYDYHLVNDLRLTEHYGEGNWSTLSFFVSGNVRTTIKGLTDGVDELAGRTYLSSCPDTFEAEDWAGGQHLQRLHISFQPSYFLSHFPPDQIETLPRVVRDAIAKTIQPYYHQGSMTPAMQTIVHQILQCPYQGAMKRLYLEGKALELMTLQFCQFQDQQPRASVSILLKSDDIDRIHQAKNILIANLTNPPSLLELARRVAINDHKLKQGFHQVFGTTVFGYLHDYRMEQARHLLETSELSIAEVTQQIGFIDRSHFAAAFRKKFGLNPSEYMRRHRRSVRAV